VNISGELKDLQIPTHLQVRYFFNTQKFIISSTKTSEDFPLSCQIGWKNFARYLSCDSALAQEAGIRGIFKITICRSIPLIEPLLLARAQALNLPTTY